MLREQGVAGSNPVAPTLIFNHLGRRPYLVGKIFPEYSHDFISSRHPRSETCLVVGRTWSAIVIMIFAIRFAVMQADLGMDRMQILEYVRSIIPIVVQMKGNGQWGSVVSEIIIGNYTAGEPILTHPQ